MRPKQGQSKSADQPAERERDRHAELEDIRRITEGLRREYFYGA